MTEKIKNLVEEILGNVKQMAISTCKDNKPWSATVLFAFDKNLNIYFFSTEERRHSKEIAKNPHGELQKIRTHHHIHIDMVRAAEELAKLKKYSTTRREAFMDIFAERCYGKVRRQSCNNNRSK